MYIPMALPTLAQYPSRIGQCEFLEIDEEELDTLSLYARLVKSPTREILLSGHAYWNGFSSDSDLDAVNLLSDLSRLAPSVAKDFIPKDHAESAITFRLINDIDFHAEETGYIALSYCWKTVSGDTPRRVVTPVGDLPFGWTKEVEQFPLPTSNTLFQAVLRERREGEGLWFDQVCINQDDETETATTIGVIDIIYKNARAVVVALDDIVATPEEEQFLRFYAEQYSYCELPLEQQPYAGLVPPFMHQNPIFKTFIERVLSSQSFERAWCTHEMRMGQSHVFLLPCQILDDDEMQSVIRFTGAFFLHMLVLAGETHTLQPTLYAKVQPLQEFFHQQVQTRNQRAMSVHSPSSTHLPFRPPPPQPSFVSTIASTFALKASGNPRLPEYLRRLSANRDKTCLALNASTLPLALAPATHFSRPSIEDECLRTLLLTGLAARDPVTLCTTGPPLHLHDGSTSWLCRPTAMDTPAHLPSPPRFAKHSTHSITQASDGKAEYVQLDLLFLDLPHRTSPNPHFPAHARRARLFIDTCIAYQIGGTGLWTFWQSPNHPRASALRNVFIQTLACVFSCGVQWVCEIQASLSSTGVVPMAPYTVATLLNPHLILQSYVHLTEGQAALSALLSFLSALIGAGIPWGSSASERSHGPLIVAAPTPAQSPSSSSPDPVPVSSLEPSLSPSLNTSPPTIPSLYPTTPTTQHSPPKALTFAPFTHSKTLLLAIPAALASSPYSALARAWVLTSMNPYTGVVECVKPSASSASAAPGTKPPVSWTLQSKSVVFGDSGFASALEACGEEAVRRHRVYGPVG